MQRQFLPDLHSFSEHFGIAEVRAIKNAVALATSPVMEQSCE